MCQRKGTRSPGEPDGWRRKNSPSSDLHVSPRGEAKCVRGPSGRGARRKPAQVPRFSRNTDHETRDTAFMFFTNHGFYASCLGATAVLPAWFWGHESRDTNHESRLFFESRPFSRVLRPSGGEKCRPAARVKSPVEGAAGSCGRSARSEEDGDPGDLLRRTTKPTTANVRRPKGYAPFRSVARRARRRLPEAAGQYAIGPEARNAARVTFDTGCQTWADTAGKLIS